MVFACQMNCYLKEYRSEIVWCEPSVLNITKTETIDGCEMILKDTILFPEGGGQPCDYGTIDGEEVINVWRKGTDAVHFVKTPKKTFKTGDSVEVKVNWDRRWDHMQQHSAQHLISAIAEDMFHMPTSSWSLGESVSSIELDAQKIEDNVIMQLETVLNEKIRESVPIRIVLYKKEDDELKNVRTRLELPDDQMGPIRVVNIEGIDRNTCCGTHVSNLCHLQMIKLLYTEKGKKNKTNLYFVAGERVLKYLGKSVKREKLLMSSLKCGADDFGSMIDKLQKSLKLSQKNCLNVIRELALSEAKKFLDIPEKPKFYSIHRKESDSDFISIFVNEVSDSAKDTLLFISVTDDCTKQNSGGQITLAGNTKLVEQFSGKVAEMLMGKGILKDGKFQAKVSNLSKRSKVDDLIKMEMQIE